MMAAPSTLAAYEAWLNTQPSWARPAAGACLVLARRLAQGEAWSAQLQQDVADAHRAPLARSGQTNNFLALTGA
jgi:hypothetical protein